MTYRPKPARPVRHYMKIEGHGETGDGKTRFGASLPGPRFWFDPTRGADNFQVHHLAECPYESGGECVGAAGIGGAPCEGDYRENSLNPDTFVASCEWAIAAAHAGAVKAIILDDVTVIQEQLKYVVIGENAVRPSIDQWGPIKRPIDRILTKIVGAPCHLYVTSRASMVGVDATETGKVKNVYKTARPKAWDNWIYPMDYSLFLYSEGNEIDPAGIEYYAQVQKCRGLHERGFPLKPGQIVKDPTFERVFGGILAMEAGAPLAEYDDPDSALAAGRRDGANLARVAGEQIVEEFRAKCLVASGRRAMDDLAAAWQWVTGPDMRAQYTKVHAEEIKRVKDETKVAIEQANQSGEGVRAESPTKTKETKR